MTIDIVMLLESFILLAKFFTREYKFDSKSRNLILLKFKNLASR